MKEIKPEQLTQNIIDLIGHQWMLITAGNSADYNMMTASWGGMGYLWNKPVATIYVRPERLTDQYINNSGRFTLTFFPQSMRPRQK
jgi:flavin reductase (DIM6/NTAB) family NADH-FMN oxidoreductase RutF